jgi:uncharacterized protein with HEPN domain
MNQKNDFVFIEHILESIKAIEKFSKKMTKNDLLKNRLRQSAIIRELEIIGEAVKNISKPIKEKYKEVQWKEISEARDKMVHHYFGIDLEIIWEIIKIELPELKSQMLKIKSNLKKEV